MSGGAVCTDRGNCSGDGAHTVRMPGEQWLTSSRWHRSVPTIVGATLRWRTKKHISYRWQGPNYADGALAGQDEVGVPGGMGGAARGISVRRSAAACRAIRHRVESGRRGICGRLQPSLLKCHRQRAPSASLTIQLDTEQPRPPRRRPSRFFYARRQKRLSPVPELETRRPYLAVAVEPVSALACEGVLRAVSPDGGGHTGLLRNSSTNPLSPRDR